MKGSLCTRGFYCNDSEIVLFFRGRGGWQNDGAEAEGRGGEEEDKGDWGEDVFRGNQGTGALSLMSSLWLYICIYFLRAKLQQIL